MTSQPSEPPSRAWAHQWLAATLGGGAAPEPPPAASETAGALLIETAIGHGLAPLLPKELPPWIGEAARERLRKARAFTLAANVRQLQAAREVREALSRKGIQSAALKGAALLEAGIYEPGERAMTDIDLLVRREDLENARKIILSQGWSEESPAARRYALRHHHHWRYLKPGTPGLLLELHWAPSHAELKIPPWEILAGEEGALAASGLPWAAQIYFLAANAALHGFSDRLLVLYDLKYAVRKLKTLEEWEHLRQLARHSHMERAARVALACAEKIFGLEEAPPDFLRLHGGAEEKLLAEFSDLTRERGRWKRRYLRMAMADSWGERARLGWLAFGRLLARGDRDGEMGPKEPVSSRT